MQLTSALGTDSRSERPRWITAAFGSAADTSTLELSALGDHLQLCQRLSGRLFGLRCGAAAVHRFVAGRFVTTLAVALLAMGLAWLVS